MNITGSIPIEPHLLAYVRWKEKLQDEECILDINYAPSDISFFLACTLVGKLQSDPYAEENLADKYSESLRFHINPRRFNHGRIVISIESVRIFNKFLHRNMHEILLERVLLGKAQGKKESDIIYDFREEIGAIDLISFDALKKAQTRLRNRKKIVDFQLQSRQQGSAA